MMLSLTQFRTRLLNLKILMIQIKVAWIGLILGHMLKQVVPLRQLNLGAIKAQMQVFTLRISFCLVNMQLHHGLESQLDLFH